MRSAPESCGRDRELDEAGDGAAWGRKDDQDGEGLDHRGHRRQAGVEKLPVLVVVDLPALHQLLDNGQWSDDIRSQLQALLKE